MDNFNYRVVQHQFHGTTFFGMRWVDDQGRIHPDEEIPAAKTMGELKTMVGKMQQALSLPILKV